MAQTERDIGEILFDNGAVSREQLDAAALEAGRTGDSAWNVLLRGNAVREVDVLRARAVQAGLKFVDLTVEAPDPGAAALLPYEVASRVQALCMRVGAGSVVVAMADPTNREYQTEVARKTGMQVVPAVAHPPELARAIDRSYGQNGRAGTPSPPSPAFAPNPTPAPPPLRAEPLGGNEMAETGSIPGGPPAAMPPPAGPATVAPAPGGNDHGLGNGNGYVTPPGPGEKAAAPGLGSPAPLGGSPAAVAPSPVAPAVESGEGPMPPAETTPAGNPTQSFSGEDLPMVEVSAPAEPKAEGTEEEEEEKDPNLSAFLEEVMAGSGSDLHLTAGLPPMIRVNGEIRAVKGYRRLKPNDLQELLYSILTQKQREKFEEELELDISYSLPGKARFRVNVFQQRDALGAVMRLIPYEIKDPDALGLPQAVSEFSKLKRGLVLVTGITGSGKSTTLAALVDIVNSSRPDHIMTVEDPIEFLHRHKKAVVNQREVGHDTASFSNALKHVLRQDPDVILVGEMRDLETISTALTAAETGHLVFGTLHTQDAPQSVDRVIDVFPPHQQQQIRVQLAGTLAGVVSQQLVRSSDGKGRSVAVEVLVATPAVKNLIREGKTHQIYTSMQAGGKYGMQTMDQHLAQLVKSGTLNYETALEHCHKPEEFNRLVGKGGASDG